MQCFLRSLPKTMHQSGLTTGKGSVHSEQQTTKGAMQVFTFRKCQLVAVKHNRCLTSVFFSEWKKVQFCWSLGFNWSGVDPPLSSSRACLTAFIANSVP